MKYYKFSFIYPILFTILIIIFLNKTIGYLHNKDTIIYCDTYNNKSFVVLGIDIKLDLQSIYIDAQDYNTKNSIVIVYNKNYKKYNRLEPSAVFEDGELLYYNPLNKTSVSPHDMSIKYVKRITGDYKDGIIATIDSNYIMEAKKYIDKNALFSVKSYDFGRIKTRAIGLGRNITYNKLSQIKKFNLKEKDKRFIKVLNDWINCDIGYDPAKIVITPNLIQLTDSIDYILNFLPSNHKYVLKTSHLTDLILLNNVRHFNPVDSCYYHTDYSNYLTGKNNSTEGVKRFVSDYFKNKELDVLICYGYNDISYPFSFTWMLVYDNKAKFLYSFLFNLQD